MGYAPRSTSSSSSARSSCSPDPRRDAGGPAGSHPAGADVVHDPAGGFVPAGAVGFWGILAPLAALVLTDIRDAARWFVAWVVVFLFSGIVGGLIEPVPPPLPEWFTSTMLALNVVVGGTIVFILLAVFAQQRRAALVALREEQVRAENLLLPASSPRSIAERLKDDTQPIADQFGSASILFADVVDFTPWSERRSAAEVVGFLDHLFSHFDVLADRVRAPRRSRRSRGLLHGRRGRPSPRPDHARALALVALDMLDAMRTTEVVGDFGPRDRIGINSGPVVAGVIGRKRFPVRPVGRRGQHREPDGIRHAGSGQVTRATRDLLADEFDLEPRGTVQVKGKGEIETWYLVGPKAPGES